MTNEAKTWKHEGRTFCACSNPKCGRPALVKSDSFTRFHGQYGQCHLCRGARSLSIAIPAEETERRRLAAMCPPASYVAVISDGKLGLGGAEVNITPWPDTADNPECEDKPAEQSKSGIMRLPSDSPWLRDLAASIDARPALILPDLRALHDPHPTPEPDTYGTDAARLEDSLRYWAELDLDPAPPCGHFRELTVRGYCVACVWEANDVRPWSADDNDTRANLRRESTIAADETARTVRPPGHRRLGEILAKPRTWSTKR